jgi:hypothetical protein
MPAPGDEGEVTTVSMGSERAGAELARVSSSAPSGAEAAGVVLDRVILRRFRGGSTLGTRGGSGDGVSGGLTGGGYAHMNSSCGGSE